MEIGPLSEWVTAAAEILAVCTALFLPTITNARTAKRRERKLATSIKHITHQALQGDADAGHQLEIFIKIYFFIAETSHEQNDLLIATQIVDLLDHKTVDEEVTSAVTQLLKDLD
ncbi:hypothetical protein [Furfurilactobacillus entadae]|uniref:hypothetical protein n=1 Tax=Furfurilactobacillus entadae TaxID=2922307 RepID=UPI0035E6A3EA